jgi:hypothetical protein
MHKNSPLTMNLRLILRGVKRLEKLPINDARALLFSRFIRKCVV